MPKVVADFRPLWWLKNPHLQTLFAAKCRGRITVDMEPERLELPDGDFVDLMWTGGNSGPVVCVFHGLEGSAESNYCRGLMAQIERRGWTGVLMQFRGCSGVPNRLSRSYHAADTGDIATLIDEVVTRYPNRPIAAVGYSLGANALLCYLADRGQNTPLIAAAAVSPPLVPALAANRLNQGFSRIYRLSLVSALKSSAARKRDQLRACGIDWNRVSNAVDFWDIDDALVAPLHGFRSVHEYYQAAHSRSRLRDIRIPTLVIHSSDDPFFGPEVVPEAEEIPDCVQFECATHGGHVGFVSGRFRPRYWLDERLPAWLTSQALSQ